ncbi:sugar ABC transporter permease [Microbacterium kribbense]|uniref:Sugar ABC transporter permease n=1 Tax=Microbacterium kribbense TaxID=433645 RepID=A0ABP7GSC1_9MICO
MPSIRGTIYAFTDWNGLDASFDFIGIKNFLTVLDSPSNVHAIQITVTIAIVVTVLQNVIGLLLALGVNSRIKSRNVLRVLLFAPAVITPVVAAYLFQYMFAPNGPINGALSAAGLGGLQQNWLGDPDLALVSILILMLWRGSGYSMVIFLAGLQGIPDEVLEAASIDGAGPIRRFWSVVRPLLAPALTINVMLTLLHGLMVFGEVWIMTAGGPGTATDTLSTSIYKNAFIFGDYSVGITQALILFILVAAISIFQYRSLLKQEKKN